MYIIPFNSVWTTDGTAIGVGLRTRFTVVGFVIRLRGSDIDFIFC